MASTEAPDMDQLPERLSNRSLMPLKRDLALLDPGQLSQMAEEAAHELMAEGESNNTRASYKAAMRYWAARSERNACPLTY